LYDEMWEMVQVLIKEKTLVLSNEEKTLFGVACKNYINKERYLMRTIKSVMTLLAYKTKKPLLEEYLKRNCKRFEACCLHVVEQIDKLVLEPEATTENPNQDGLAFYWKTKADMYRYICESATGERLAEIKVEAKKCYQKANSFTINSVGPTKISIGLNFSVFEVEYGKNLHLGIKMSEKMLSEALEKMDALPESEYKEVDTILEVVKENVSLWKDQQEREKERAKQQSQTSK